ncbi:MAG: TonB family protein [Thermoanaerobaculia bacterium]
MPDNILVVEYEPKYTDRVRQALTGQPVTASFARDGEEALRALAAELPALVVLSSVVPKGNAGDIIKALRSRSATTPILLVVSGYNGKEPAQDAARFGVSDILPKPYTETDFLGKVQRILGLPSGPQLTSDDIFGDIVDHTAPAPAAPAASAAAAPRKSNPTGNIDKMLADTLGGVMPKRSATSPGTTAKPKSIAELDKILNDSLSGLEKRKAPVRSDPPPPERAVSAAPPIPAEPVPPAKEEPEPTDGVRFGQYVLLEKIATGGMAEVWKARKRGEEGFQKIVAIKKILPHLSDNQEFIEMFIDEAKLAAQLNHNNIIHIYDLGKIGSSYYLAMEYVDGNDLKTLIKRGQDKDHPLGVELGLFIASRLAAALDYAHRKRDFSQVEMGLVHRDVSPQNVLISQDGDVKLCDFGIAKAASKASHTQAGALKGKLQYMSPEQASGKNIDRRSDIFAVAAVLFEMLTGRKLFSGESEMSILEQVREARVTPPSQWNDEVTPEIDAIVAKGLQKNPDDRYQTAAEMAKDIEAVLYTLRPTPTSADLAIYMHRLAVPDPVPPPVHEAPPPPVAPPPPPKVVPAPVAPAPVRAATPMSQSGVPMPSWEAPASAHAAAPAAAKKRSAVVPIIFVVLLLVGGIAGGYFYLQSRPSPEQSADASTNAATMAPAADPAVAPPLTPAETGTLIPVPTETTNTNPAATASVAPALDPALVDQEVQRLIAAERTRLAQQQAAAAQRAQPASAPGPAPVVRAPAPQPPPTETVAPPPEPEPVPTATTATQAAESGPVPTETAPAQPRFRPGDLVPMGTEGLTPARVIRYGTVPYPQMARTQRVQGTILMSVLVSEEGKVLDIRMIRGVNRPVGLNEAAEQVIRRSTFSSPLMRDGTRVKAWTTVPVKFEL